MTGTAHFMTGAAVGKLTGNIWLALLASFFVHFLMDMVPHWDYAYHLKKTKTSMAIAALDPLIGVAVVSVLLFSDGVIGGMSDILALVGGFASLLPDVIEMISSLFTIKSMRWYRDFHERIHWFLPRLSWFYQAPKNAVHITEWRITSRGVFLGILMQLPFILLASYVLLW